MKKYKGLNIPKGVFVKAPTLEDDICTAVYEKNRKGDNQCNSIKLCGGCVLSSGNSKLRLKYYNKLQRKAGKKKQEQIKIASDECIKVAGEIFKELRVMKLKNDINTAKEKAITELTDLKDKGFITPVIILTCYAEVLEAIDKFNNSK